MITFSHLYFATNLCTARSLSGELRCKVAVNWRVITHPALFSILVWLTPVLPTCWSWIWFISLKFHYPSVACLKKTKCKDLSERRFINLLKLESEDVAVQSIFKWHDDQRYTAICREYLLTKNAGLFWNVLIMCGLWGGEQMWNSFCRSLFFLVGVFYNWSTGLWSISVWVIRASTFGCFERL